jgi:ribose transport system permease protein
MAEKTINKKKFKFTYQMGLFVFLAALILFFGGMEDWIITKPKVLFGLTENIMEIGLMALPMTLIIITSGIDLSVGSNMALSAVVLGAVYGATQNFGLALACCLLTGILAGALNGLLIAKTKIAPLVMTLATMSLYLGIAKIISGTRIFSDFPDGFTFLQTSKLFGVVPYQFLLFIVLAIIFWLFLEKSSIGRYIRGLGLNEDAVKYSGVKIASIKFSLYTVSGFICAIASLVYLSHLPAAKPDMGNNLNLQAITAVVLGGTSIMGGIGNMTGTILGVLIIGVLRKGLQLIGLGGDIYSFILGLVLVICLIGFSVFENRKKLEL